MNVNASARRLYVHKFAQANIKGSIKGTSLVLCERNLRAIGNAERIPISCTIRIAIVTGGGVGVGDS